MDIYEKEEVLMREINKKNLLKNIKKRKYQEKIKKYAEKFNYEVNYLEQILLEDDFLINSISKDPTKQNFQEKIAKEFLEKNIEGIKNFEILPKNGEKSKYLANGVLLTKEELTTDNHTKSIDFYWEYKDYKFYATHKYTKESGGAQDNQYDDVKKFLSHAKQYTKKGVFFIAICNGNYYKKIIKASGISKLEYLRNSVKDTNCIVCDVYTLKNEIEKII